MDATRRKIKKLSDQKAADLGYVGLLKDRRSRGVLRDEYLLCAAAARSGQLEELKALRADNFPWNRPSTCATAARPWDASTCACAALGGHLEVLKWARANGCPWNLLTCAKAAEYDHLEVLKWARANKCPWDEVTCAYAAKGGHLEVLKWLRANDCPWSEYMQYTRYRDIPMRYDDYVTLRGIAETLSEIL